MQLEGDKHGLPSKNEIAAYLKKYVKRFEIPIQLRTEVISVQKLNNYFLIKQTGKNIKRRIWWWPQALSYP